MRWSSALLNLPATLRWTLNRVWLSVMSLEVDRIRSSQVRYLRPSRGIRRWAVQNVVPSHLAEVGTLRGLHCLGFEQPEEEDEVSMVPERS